MSESLTKYWKRRDMKDGWIFILPAVVLYGAFMFIPLFGTMLLTFSEYQITAPPEFVGLRNIRRFLDDGRVQVIWATTLKLAVVLVVQHMMFGLLLALGVNRQINHVKKSVYRILFFLPVIVTTASVAIAWSYAYSTEFGVINYLLGWIGIDPVPWLSSSFWSVPTIAFFSLWKFVGNSFMYYLIGLQSIDHVYYETAHIEGASDTQMFFRVTLPLLTPTVFFVMVNLIIGAIQIFDEPFLITGGGPGDSSRTVNLFIYETAYRSFDLGYASTIALSLFVFILFVTLMQFKVSGLWVNYDNE